MQVWKRDDEDDDAGIRQGGTLNGKVRRDAVRARRRGRTREVEEELLASLTTDLGRRRDGRGRC